MPAGPAVRPDGPDGRHVPWPPPPVGSRRASRSRRFAVSEDAAGPWFGHAPLAGCKVPGCGSGRHAAGSAPGTCAHGNGPGNRRDGGWLAGLPPVVPDTGQGTCRISYCQLWAHPGAALCYSHRRRRKNLGCPDLEEFAAGYDVPAGGREQADLTALPDRLRLEVQYALHAGTTTT